MSLYYTDSFDGYTTAEVTQFWIDATILGGAFAIITTDQRTGRGAIQIGAGAMHLDVGTQTNFIVGAGIKKNGPISSDAFVMLEPTGPSTTNTSVILHVNNNGRMRIIRGGDNAILVDGSADPLFRSSKYFWIEWIGDCTASGTHKVYVDGQKVIDAVLDVPGSGTHTRFTRLAISGAGGGDSQDYDDFYFALNDGTGLTTTIGDSSVFGLLPSADGALLEWTPNSGTPHFSRVNEIPRDDDTSYNFSTGAGERDTYIAAAISGSGATPTTPSSLANSDSIFGAELTQWTKDDGTAVTLRPYILTSSTATETSGDDYTTTSVYTKHVRKYESFTTGTQINATEWGIKHV